MTRLTYFDLEGEVTHQYCSTASQEGLRLYDHDTTWHVFWEAQE